MVSKQDYTLLQSFIDVIGFLLLSVVIITQSVVKFFLPKSYHSYKDIKGDVALVTGGGSGLGRLLALRLARLGAIVVLWDVNLPGVEETVKLIKGIGGVAHGYKCDLADKEDVYRIAEKTRQEVGDVTILINNAGVVSGTTLLDTPDHLIKRTFDVNILAHFWTVKAFLPKMIEHNKGHIVTIASMAGHVGIYKLVDYCATKYAAVGFDESLKVELEVQGIKGVKTTVICPYFIQSTGMFEEVNSRFMPRLKSNDVADRAIEALLREEHMVMLPGVFTIGMVFKAMVPWACISMFLRNLVPDAAPKPPTEEPVTNVPTTQTKIKNGLSKTVTELNHRVLVDGKNV